MEDHSNAMSWEFVAILVDAVSKRTHSFGGNYGDPIQVGMVFMIINIAVFAVYVAVTYYFEDDRVDRTAQKRYPKFMQPGLASTKAPTRKSPLASSF